ncbi:radical SAM protein [Patescibacteria group bacterium]|nr:radical SAM protein [Patescibacteria group bacterium]
MNKEQKIKEVDKMNETKNIEYIARKEENGDWLVFNSTDHSVKWLNDNQLKKLNNVKTIVRSLVSDAMTAPIKLFVNVNNKCNLECKHCFSASSPVGNYQIPYDNFIKIIDEASEMGIFLFVIGGGEPLLRNDIWKVISYIRSKGMGVSLTTNGTVCNDEIINNIKEYDVRMNISFDGKEETHDSVRGRKGVYRTALKNVKIMVANGIKPTIRFTLMPLNIKDTPHMISLADTLGLKLKVRRAKPASRTMKNDMIIKHIDQEYLEAINLLNNSPNCGVEDIMNINFRAKEPLLVSDSDCGAATRIMFIEADGKISPCSFLRDEFCSGSIYTDTLESIWRDSSQFKLIRNLKLNKECATCHRKRVCHAECPSIRLYVNGSLDAEDPGCLKNHIKQTIT